MRGWLQVGTPHFSDEVAVATTTAEQKALAKLAEADDGPVSEAFSLIIGEADRSQRT